MRCELVTEPGEPDIPNEDFAALAVPASGQGGALVLLDGVTPPKGGTGCVHSVPWFTARLGGALSELSVSRRDLALRQVLAGAVRRAAAAHETTCDLSHPRTPQSTVVLARWSPEQVEYLVLSDSLLLAESDDGTVTALRDDRLERIPRASLTSEERVDATLRNKEGGFFTAAADPSVVERAVTGVLPRPGVRSLTALTDGASRWVERFDQGDWQDCVRVVRREGARGLVDRVRALERADEQRGVVRRGKLHDDAAVIHVEL